MITVNSPDKRSLMCCMPLCLARYRVNVDSIPVDLCGKQMIPLSMETLRAAVNHTGNFRGKYGDGRLVLDVAGEKARRQENSESEHEHLDQSKRNEEFELVRYQLFFFRQGRVALRIC